MSVKDLVQQAATSPKTAGVVSGLTTGTGLGTVLDYIPDDIGKLATLVGIVLSIVLIRNHWRKGRAETEKIQLEINALRLQEEERKALAADRRRRGLPVRRGEDR